MRAQIAITRTGVIQASPGQTPPEGGALARRINGDFIVSLHRKVSEAALVQLLRSLRALDPDFRMSLDTAEKVREGLTRRQVCHRIALYAISIVERANENMFMSNLELFNAAHPPSTLLSENLLRLAGLNLATDDTPSALMRVSAANIDNLVSVGQNRSMRLYFLAIPEDHMWPGTAPPPGAPIDDFVDAPSWRWLSLIYEAALAIQAAMFQHGFLRLHGGNMRPFQRFIYPITPPHEQPGNYRVLTAAEIMESPDLVII